MYKENRFIYKKGPEAPCPPDKPELDKAGINALDDRIDDVLEPNVEKLQEKIEGMEEKANEAADKELEQKGLNKRYPERSKGFAELVASIPDAEIIKETDNDFIKDYLNNYKTKEFRGTEKEQFLERIATGLGIDVGWQGSDTEIDREIRNKLKPIKEKIAKRKIREQIKAVQEKHKGSLNKKPEYRKAKAALEAAKKELSIAKARLKAAEKKLEDYLRANEKWQGKLNKEALAKVKAYYKGRLDKTQKGSDAARLAQNEKELAEAIDTYEKMDKEVKRLEKEISRIKQAMKKMEEGSKKAAEKEIKGLKTEKHLKEVMDKITDEEMIKEIDNPFIKKYLQNYKTRKFKGTEKHQFLQEIAEGLKISLSFKFNDTEIDKAIRAKIKEHKRDLAKRKIQKQIEAVKRKHLAELKKNTEYTKAKLSLKAAESAKRAAEQKRTEAAKRKETEKKEIERDKKLIEGLERALENVEDGDITEMVKREAEKIRAKLNGKCKPSEKLKLPKHTMIDPRVEDLYKESGVKVNEKSITGIDGGKNIAIPEGAKVFVAKDEKATGFKQFSITVVGEQGWETYIFTGNKITEKIVNGSTTEKAPEPDAEKGPKLPKNVTVDPKAMALFKASGIQITENIIEMHIIDKDGKTRKNLGANSKVLIRLTPGHEDKRIDIVVDFPNGLQMAYTYEEGKEVKITTIRKPEPTKDKIPYIEKAELQKRFTALAEKYNKIKGLRAVMRGEHLYVANSKTGEVVSFSQEKKEDDGGFNIYKSTDKGKTWSKGAFDKAVKYEDALAKLDEIVKAITPKTDEKPVPEPKPEENPDTLGQNLDWIPARMLGKMLGELEGKLKPHEKEVGFKISVKDNKLEIKHNSGWTWILYQEDPNDSNEAGFNIAVVDHKGATKRHLFDKSVPFSEAAKDLEKRLTPHEEDKPEMEIMSKAEALKRVTKLSKHLKSKFGERIITKIKTNGVLQIGIYPKGSKKAEIAYLINQNENYNDFVIQRFNKRLPNGKWDEKSRVLLDASTDNKPWTTIAEAQTLLEKDIAGQIKGLDAEAPKPPEDAEKGPKPLSAKENNKHMRRIKGELRKLYGKNKHIGRIKTFKRGKGAGEVKNHEYVEVPFKRQGTKDTLILALVPRADGTYNIGTNEVEKGKWKDLKVLKDFNTIAEAEKFFKEKLASYAEDLAKLPKLKEHNKAIKSLLKKLPKNKFVGKGKIVIATNGLTEGYSEIDIPLKGIGIEKGIKLGIYVEDNGTYGVTKWNGKEWKDITKDKPTLKEAGDFLIKTLKEHTALMEKREKLQKDLQVFNKEATALDAVLYKVYGGHQFRFKHEKVTGNKVHGMDVPRVSLTKSKEYTITLIPFVDPATDEIEYQVREMRAGDTKGTSKYKGKSLGEAIKHFNSAVEDSGLFKETKAIASEKMPKILGALAKDLNKRSIWGEEIGVQAGWDGGKRELNANIFHKGTKKVSFQLQLNPRGGAHVMKDGEPIGRLGKTTFEDVKALFLRKVRAAEAKALAEANNNLDGKLAGLAAELYETYGNKLKEIRFNRARGSLEVGVKVIGGKDISLALYKTPLDKADDDPKAYWLIIDQDGRGSVHLETGTSFEKVVKTLMAQVADPKMPKSAFDTNDTKLDPLIEGILGLGEKLEKHYTVGDKKPEWLDVIQNKEVGGVDIFIEAKGKTHNFRIRPSEGGKGTFDLYEVIDGKEKLLDNKGTSAESYEEYLKGKINTIRGIESGAAPKVDQGRRIASLKPVAGATPAENAPEAVKTKMSSKAILKAIKDAKIGKLAHQKNQWIINAMYYGTDPKGAYRRAKELGINMRKLTGKNREKKFNFNDHDLIP